MLLIKKIFILPKALRQLGFKPVWLYFAYQVKLRSGWLRLLTPPGRREVSAQAHLRIVVMPAKKEEIQKVLGEREKDVYAEADEVLGGRVRLFGAEPRKLELSVPGVLMHWTRYASQMPDGSDIKPVWEAGRFGWATVLARAYWLSGDEKYADGFWRYFEAFTAANPPNLGPHWSSAQEVALRIVAWAFCYSLLADAASTTAARKAALATAVAQHAERIPPTLDYARAQNNNHLLNEALGLYTAAALLAEHPKAAEWKSLGRAAFEEGLENQIHDDGAYAQHSSNYHRLLLHLGLWAACVSAVFGEPLPDTSLRRLGSATDWLFYLLDDESGGVPNLGPNDGAYILPLSVLSFEDYRPVMQAASSLFSDGAAVDSGVWDEMSLWLGIQTAKPRKTRGLRASPLRLDGKDSWATLRAAQFKERPGHADQLQFDLWWRGVNLAQDAGSYLYNAPAPWNNALASGRAHNAVTINGDEPMTRAGRFLWLDWAQATGLTKQQGKNGLLVSVSAQHDGYRRVGIAYRRDVAIEANRWIVTDHLLPAESKRKEIEARIHWLLQDWDWQLDQQELRLESPHGTVELAVETSIGETVEFGVIRAGELLHGSGPADPIMGWVSPTYGVKVPALSFIIDVTGIPPFTITTTWTLPK